MFIVLISRGVPSKRDPQWGCFEKDQAEALAAMGHKVVVASVDGRFRLYWRKLGCSYYMINNIPYYNCYIVPNVITKLLGGASFSYTISRMQLSFLYKKIVKEYGKPDIIYSHYLTNSYISLFFKTKYNIPIVAIEHWSEVNKDVLKNYVRDFGVKVYNIVDRVISVSESLQKRLEEHFNIKSIVVHNMVGEEFCKPLKFNQIKQKLRFISTGRLVYLKGYDLLINALSRCNITQVSWELYIIGDGSERTKLQNLINRLGLRENIFLLGMKNKTQIVGFLEESDVFILPSRTENFSVAVLEALCMGLPVVASICGGIRECINEENGILFPVDDEDMLIKSLEIIFEKYNSFNREKIAREARANFSPSCIAADLTRIFANVLDESK